MTEPSTERGILRGPPPEPPHDERNRARRGALPWLLAAIVLLAVAAVAGLGTAYLVANLRAVPSPDAAFLPTPTPTSSPAQSPIRTPDSPAASPDGTPTAPPTPTSSLDPTAEPRPGPTPFVYTVVRGDTIGRIATRFGVTPESIIALNELRNPNRIRPGQELLIPVAPE